MATLAEYRSQIRSIGNFPADDTRITDAVVDREINRALKRIAMVHDWPWLQDEKTYTLISGLAAYSLPDDFLRLVSLRFYGASGSGNLSLRAIQEVDNLSDASQSGEPLGFGLWAGKIKFGPTPGGTYTVRLRYIATENVLSNDSDVSRLPDYWDNGVIDAALVELYRTAARSDEAVLSEQRFEMWVTETQDNVRQSREAPRVRVRPGSII